VRILHALMFVLACAACAFAQQPVISAMSDHAGRAVRELFRKDDARTAGTAEILARQDVERYELDVCVDPPRRRVSGECAITMRAGADRLTLVLNEGLAVTTVRAASGAALAFVRDGRTISVLLRGVPEGPVRVVLRYQGTVAAGGGILANPGLLYLGGESAWYPMSEAHDPATMRIVLRYPDEYSSVCTGMLVGMAMPSSDGRCSAGDIWESAEPLAAASAAVGRIGNSFGVWGNVFLGYHWYVPAPGDTLTGGWKPDVPPGPAGELKGLVGYLEACYGGYPFRWLNVLLLPPNLEGFESAASGAGLIVVQDVDGLGLTSGSSALTRCSLELARSWWACSMDAGALVAEGLSAAAEVDWLEATGGDEEALRRREFRRAQYARALSEAGGSAPLSACLGESPCDDRRICRGKGAALFDMLERLIGRDAYCRALRVFAERHRGRTAGFRDLVAAFEEATEQDLNWFFYEWVYRGDLPTYVLDYTVSHVRGRRYRVQGTIRQDGEIYRTPVPLTVDLGLWSYDEVVAIESSEQPFDFVAESEPLRILVDADGVLPVIESADRARAHFERGNAAKAANDWATAVNEYGAAAFLAPRQASYRYAYGEALVRSGRLTAGLEALDAAARLDPKNAGLRLWLGQLYLRANAHTAALRHLDAYVSMKKDDPIGHATRAMALVGLRRLDEARTGIAAARLLVAKTGSQPQALEALYLASGRYHEAAGDRAAAVADYERALRANPVSDEARKRLAAIEAGSR